MNNLEHKRPIKGNIEPISRVTVLDPIQITNTWKEFNLTQIESDITNLKQSVKELKLGLVAIVLTIVFLLI